LELESELLRGRLADLLSRFSTCALQHLNVMKKEHGGKSKANPPVEKVIFYKHDGIQN
jgi:hypothetical protein